MQKYQAEFIDFLVQAGALTFGDFTTKSGRKTPYFVNTGNFDNGQKIARLGTYYAQHIISAGLGRLDVVFGPAYKGIPLCVTTAANLFTNHNKSVGFCFDRKEIKDHGERGRFVGANLKPGSKLVLVEDVITAGTTMHEIVPTLRAMDGLELLGVVLAVDRCERGKGDLSAVQEVAQELGISVYPIVNVHQIVEYLSGPNGSGLVLSDDLKQRIAQYLAAYGAK